MVTETEAYHLRKYIYISTFILISPKFTKRLHTSNEFCLLLSARASWSLSVKVKVLNAELPSKLRFGLLKKPTPRKPTRSFYIFTIFRLGLFKCICQLSSFSELFLPLKTVEVYCTLYFPMAKWKQGYKMCINIL